MTIDEGYIKYVSHWTDAPLPNPEVVTDLERWRGPLHAAGLVGHYDDLDVGFGNISVRAGEPGQFVISGTQTGHLEHTTIDHYALVTKADIEGNAVWSTGSSRASSEALTHAAIYRLSPQINAVVHVHDAALWRSYLDRLPTTRPSVSYGTPAMAAEFLRLWEIDDTGAGAEGSIGDASSGEAGDARVVPFREAGLAVMGGHEEGIVSIGRDLAEAAQRILALKAGLILHSPGGTPLSNPRGESSSR